MSCPYFREGYFGICVAPDAVHVPTIDEMEKLCFKKRHVACPHFIDDTYLPATGDSPHMHQAGARLRVKSGR